MRKSYRYLTAGLIAVLFTISASAQSVTVSGTIRNELTKEVVPAVTVALKENANQGTYTDQNGVFTLKVPRIPIVLVVSSIGFESLEINVTSATQVLDVSLKINNALGQEVVVAATRSPQRLLESPVTVERISTANIRSLAAPTIYESIGNLKGVDVHTASLTFRTVTTRGFVAVVIPALTSWLMVWITRRRV
ncbi:MAG: carboxypeptidase-like regulatory domain-containing protein [Chitinophagaceae bacterium]|nr:carboxypeptidase-like regulatory domain-containing protein [Chitinophagaceae bacterium]